MTTACRRSGWTRATGRPSTTSSSGAAWRSTSPFSSPCTAMGSSACSRTSSGSWVSPQGCGRSPGGASCSRLTGRLSSSCVRGALRGVSDAGPALRGRDSEEWSHQAAQGQAQREVRVRRGPISRSVRRLRGVVRGSPTEEAAVGRAEPGLWVLILGRNAGSGNGWKGRTSEVSDGSSGCQTCF